MATNYWYYKLGGREHGPIPEEHFLAKIEQGEIQEASTMVQSPTRTKGKWTEAGKIGGLKKRIDSIATAVAAPPVFQPDNPQLVQQTAMGYCFFCKQTVRVDTIKCSHCQEFLDNDYKPKDWNPAVAAVLSFFVPGVGQMYKGQLLSGFGFLVCIYGGYACSLLMLGLIPPIGVVAFLLVAGFHLFCVIEAAVGNA